MPEVIDPWYIHIFTKTDLERATKFPPGCFAFEFLKAITSRPAKLHYIAPGLRLPTASEISEFLGPKHDKDFLEWRYNLVRWPPHYRGIVRTGLYITEAVTINESAFGDGCTLTLPFKVGANGWARRSNGEPIKGCTYEDACAHAELYQTQGIGFNDGHSVQIYKDDDWEVGEDGVLGGPEKFKDSDSEEHWHKYWIPPSC
ncbi:hypothetical protein P170DRAFT_443341 [Aspergillus steynii IBT 23096]|uniref:Uncharacterized protein n=1 Tax=Aspergillus steynii IBT 23096 TaxID=1392250 RepID=A0A2I2GRU6_9EURO|nr:uncharacterized protein P170DRAFT_443341 [Aspergillus steynii IBT 23096]PLB55596.1 hypothetical protein P170DRAFT_443341 [Aspergillus steynii IBT 23096]